MTRDARHKFMILVNNLKFAYNNDFSVSIDHLSIQPSETVVLTGPNGAGKTTILKLLAGLLQPHQGQVIFNGVNLRRRSASHYHRRIGYVPQKPVLYNRTIAENVGLGLKIRGLPKEQRTRLVAEMLNRFGISHLADHNALKVSGGEARRAMLARALVLKPEILFLDEPFSDLDMDIKSELLNDLRPMLTESGRTVILVSHHDENISQITNRQIKITAGRIVSGK